MKKIESLLVRMGISVSITLISFMFISNKTYGQKFEPNSKILSDRKTDNGVVFEMQSSKLALQFMGDNIVRVCTYPLSKASPGKSLIVIKETLSKVNFSLEKDDSCYILKTSQIEVKVMKKNGRVSFYDKNEVPLLKEKSDGKIFYPVNIQGEATYNIRQYFSISKDEGIYGLGQTQEGIMNWRNHKDTLIQINKEVAIPFMVSTNKYGILWDNYSHTEFESIQDEMSLWSEVGDQIDYYFIYGKDADEIISGMRNLTGKVPMLPKWAYGYWQSKASYKSRREVINIARECRKRNIPIDVIVQDWQYWGKHGWSAMLWDESTYPDPKSMLDSLHNIYNIHMIISVWPCLQQGSPIADELNEKGYLFDKIAWNKGKIYDAYNEEARNIYWKHLSKGLFSVGVDGWWMDATEPEVNSVRTHQTSKTAITSLGKNSIGTFSRYLNTYPLFTCTGVYNNQRKETDKKRVLILTRSAFTGQQKTGAVTWSGDVVSSFKVLRDQISAGLNFSLSGNPYWNSDIGGFFPNRHGGEYPNGVKESAYRELYVRWFQFGTFCPIMRSHGTGTPREIWQFGEKGSIFYDALVKYDNLRYRLIPYIYSIANMVSAKDYTIMRALPMDFANDKNTYNIDDEFMFGNALLVKPVTDEIYYEKENLGNAIPSANIESSDGKKGLFKAEYFNGEHFDTLAQTKYDKNIDFSWNGVTAPGGGNDYFSIRWTGKIRANETGKYLIITNSENEIKVWIDDKLIIDNRNYASIVDRAEVNFEKDKIYNIKIEFHHKREACDVKLTWEMPHDFIKKTVKKKTSVSVYLPVCEGWYDFWTGQKVTSGRTIEKEVPLDIIPLYVKAGSILPIGPVIKYANEKPADTLEIRVYPGANAEFNLYEDESDGYNYEKGIYSIISFSWKDKAKTFTIEERKGQYPGMLKERYFRIVLVNENNGVALQQVSKHVPCYKYEGKKLEVKVD